MAEVWPKPVRIVATRFVVYREVDAAGPLDYWVKLKPQEYLQGALLQYSTEHALYIVTVEAPAISPW